ncbi:MAG: YncE family protein, partial [Candidatus Acidiferrales bacterium]
VTRLNRRRVLWDGEDHPGQWEGGTMKDAATGFSSGGASMTIILRAFFLWVLILVAIPANAATLRKVAAIDLPGPRGEHFDHLTIDYEDHYLLSAHVGPGILYVIDVRTEKLIAAIHGLPGITAAVSVPRFKKVYTCNWGENKVGVVSLEKMRVMKRLSTGEKPNGGTYAEPFAKIYISDTLGKEIVVIDVHTDAIIKTLHFRSETGMVQYDAVGGKVYVNLRSVNKIAEIDPASDTVVAEYPVGRCDFNHAMALDPANRRAFLLCGENDVLTVFDLDAHRPIAYVPVPSGGDDVKFDPGLRRIYVVCESGAISVIHEDDANHFRKLEDFPVPPGVHMLAVDIETHRVYAPEAEEDGRAVSRMLVYEAQ